MSRFINDIRKYFKYSVYAAKSELKEEVANSYLNWVWWILEPTCFMFVYMLVFGVMFGAKEKYYTAFLFLGITMWDFFSRIVNDSVKSVKNNKAIVSKVYLPKYILVIVKILVNGFKMLIGFSIVIVLMIFYHVKPGINLLFVPFILVTFLSVTFGICTYLLHFGVFVEDLSNITKIILKMVFYLTGVFYNIEKRMPGKIGEYLAKANPVALCIVSMRKVLLYGEAPHYKYLFFWFTAGTVLSFLGVRRIYKSENSYVKVL